MKIYTRIEWKWDDHAGIYRMVSADFQNYTGPVARCTGIEEAAVAAPAAESALGKGAADALAGSAAAEGAGAGLAGGLAAPETTAAFLSGVPEAVAGTTLPIGGAALDITAPGAIEAATAAGSALGPGSGAPSLLPGAAPAGGAIPAEGAAGAPAGAAEAPGVPAAPVEAVEPPAPPPGPMTAIGTPAPGPTPVASATAPTATGTAVGGGGAGVPGGGAPGLPGVPTADLSTAASAADKARLAGATTGIAQKAVNAITGNPLTAGALGLNLLAQQNAKASGKSLSSSLAKTGAPASAVADKLIAEGLSGQPSASTAYDIDQWEQAQVGAIKQRYANMGRDPLNDSAAAKELANVNAKAIAMKDQAAKGLLSAGLDASKVAQGPATSAAIAAAQQDKDLAASMGQTLQSLALLQAISSQRTPTATI